MRARVAGARQTLAAPAEELDPNLPGLIPDAKLVVIPGAGHVTNLERPEQFNEAVRQFCHFHSPRLM